MRQVEQYQNVSGMVLRSRDYKEADQLLTVYTREQGKITVQARGVKKTASKLRSGILLFSQTELVLTKGKGFPIVTGAATTTAFAALRSDFTRMTYASYGAELLDQVVVEGQSDEQLFLLILQAFHLFEYINPWLALCYLKVRLLELQGYGLQLDNCLNCERLLQNERYQAVQGGLLCTRCAAREQASFFLSQEGLTTLKALSFMPLHRLGWVYISKEGQRSVDLYLELQLQQVLSRPLKTKDFLKQVEI